MNVGPLKLEATATATLFPRASGQFTFIKVLDGMIGQKWGTTIRDFSAVANNEPG